MAILQPLSKQLLVSAILLLTGFSLLAQSKVKLPEAQQIAFDAHYFNANKFIMLAMYDDAIKELNQAQKIDAENPIINYLLGKAYLNKKVLAEAEHYSQLAVKANGNNEWYSLQLAEVYKLQKNHLAAGALFETLYKKFPDKTDYLFDATYSYVMAKDLNKALNLLIAAEKKIGLNEDIVKQKQSIYLAQNKTDKAIAEGHKLCNAYPTNTKYLGQLADIYLANAKEKEANELYRKILKLDSLNGYAWLALADYERNQKNYNNWFDYTLRAISSPTTDVKTKLTAIIGVLPTNYFNEQQSEKNLVLVTAFVNTNPGEASAWAVKGDYFAQRAQYDSAQKYYFNAVSLEPNAYGTWKQLIYVDAEIRDYNALEQHCLMASDLFPTETLFYLYRSIALQDLKSYDRCEKEVFRGLAATPSTEREYIQLLIILGDVSNKLQKHAQSDSAYDEALKLDPNNAYLLNNYAYYLSLRNTNLDKAQKMSEKSLEIEPKSASFLDTYGWILFVKKDYAGAKTQIEKSLGIEPENPEVVEHYGDVLCKLGDMNGAVANWLRAKSLKVESKTIEKKLKDKKCYEN